MRQPLKHVWLLLIPGQIHGWEIVRGICRFAKNRRWIMSICNPRTPPSRQALAKAKIDGVIGLIYHPHYVDTVKRRNIAAVNMTRGSQVGLMPSVLVDDYRCGQMAADYFLSRGFLNFGYLHAESQFVGTNTSGTSNPSYAAERERGFRERLAKSGVDINYIALDPGASVRDDPTFGGRRVARRKRNWLHNLPKPIAIFTAYDPVALDLVHECQVAGVQVPNEVAILGVHNGQILCEMSTPPLSSIDTASEQRGYLAAQMLDEQFNGAVDPARTVVLPPVGVVSRTSTDVIVAKNPVIADALHYIRDHLDRGVDVADVVEHLLISRRHLERCFATALHRTPLQEIQRLRVARAMDLLATTTLSMHKVAMQAGYGRADRMAKAVRKTTGKAPLTYRAQFKDQ